MRRWHLGAMEWQDDRHAGRLSGAVAGGYYRLPDDRDPESLSMDHGLFTDAPLETIAFRKADVVALVLYVILLLAYAGLVLLSVWIAVVKEHLNAVVAGNAAVLVITSLVERRLREDIGGLHRQGFLQLSKQLEAMAGLPFAVVAYGTAGALVLMQWEEAVQEAVKVQAVLLLRLWLLLEVAAAAVCAVLYANKVRKHNSAQPEADAVRLLAAVLRPPELQDVKYTDGGLAEEQASLLQYQQQNLLFYSREIVKLRESLSKYEQAEGGLRPGVDPAELLETRDQQLRMQVVTAQRDQLQGEVRLSRREIMDRDAEISRYRVNVDNLVEESARLRAMLDEWSAHAAKVEAALETERLANVELRKAHTSSQPSDSS